MTTRVVTGKAGAASMTGLPGWERLRHGGLLLDAQRQRDLAVHVPAEVPSFYERELRRQIGAVLDSVAGGDAAAKVPDFVAFVLRKVCGFGPETGEWLRGPSVPSEWGRAAVTGETIKPRLLWRGKKGGVLPVFLDREKRLGVGRGRKATSQTLQWLRAGEEQLAVVTNGRQWRLVFAGLDFDAWCEWDIELWLEEGELSLQVAALRALLQPALWEPPVGEGPPASRAAPPPCPLLAAILATRRGQADLSRVLGERVREAVEILLRGHGEALKSRCAGVDPAGIYRAAVRVVMRLVVTLFAESRDLLPRDNALYHGTYGLTGLFEELEKVAARGAARLARSFSAWPRVLALFRLVHQGSHHPSLPVHAYGGELFAPGDPGAPDGLPRALAVFETACFESGPDPITDRDVHRMLERITRTTIKVRQGRASIRVPAPVDFSDLSSEYIGILYEGLLDYELKTAPEEDPVVFLSVGNQPALPLSRLEAMDDKALRNLLEKMKDTSKGDDEESGDKEAGGERGEEEQAGTEDGAAPDDVTAEEPEEDEGLEDEDGESDEALRPAALERALAVAEPGAGASVTGGPAGPTAEAAAAAADLRHATRARAEAWARRAVLAGRLARKPRGKLTPEKKLAFEDAIARKARQIVSRVVLPGEWYLVRWGGTRKGSGTFYTRPGLAVPTVQRTLRPLAWDPPRGEDGRPDPAAPPTRWTPKKPEEILALKVLDPACGSGTFPVAALRFLTDALYASLHHHGRIRPEGDRSVVALLEGNGIPAGPPGHGAPPPAAPPAAPADPRSTRAAPRSVPAAPREERLGTELLPCLPGDDHFEPRLRAVLRRHVVERCIHGVDLDPLAVELCRLSLWVETMDRTLPFSFLDHKIQCGNSLVGAWFDTFQHYPAMAWKNRDGGDRGHTNGVHHAKEARTRAIKEFVKERLAPDLIDVIQRGLFRELERLPGGAAPREVHDEALAVLSRLHELPVHDAAERARLYRERLLDAAPYRSLKDAMDLWCACWFWPADELEHAPLPSAFAKPSPETRAVASRIAAEKRFFHWELEFPDVFRAEGSGFDAVLGNPPWDIAKPSSKEFFSNVDPLYRSYGKQEALRFQTDYFRDEAVERAWLDYSADFRAQSNCMKYAASPFGDPGGNEKSSDRFALGRGKTNAGLHANWRRARAAARGFADPEHPFRHQGSADLNLYKLFLEQAHALLRPGGRLGFIVPSGLYSDHGTGALRELFLERCRWEWLFGFENRDKVFDIDSRFKFNPVIVEKGGSTEAIRTAFMRRRLEDWERAEAFATPYTRAQVERFSPRSRAILEIQSARDLEILEKIYANSVLLGDDGPDGWGIKYATEFHMTNDSKLFPPRPKWEAKGYRPDEYSRWLKGDWRPIEELWAELGVDPSRPRPAEIELEDWLFDTTAGPERRTAEARFVHGHLLKPGDVARTPWRLRCAQPPYDRLPIPRADVPAGIILSREADAWIREDRVEDTALPLYLGKMIYLNQWAANPVPRDPPGRLDLDPDFLLAAKDLRHDPRAGARVVFRDISNSTNERTFISALVPGWFPCGNKVPILDTKLDLSAKLAFTTLTSSLAFDWQARTRLCSTSLNWHIVESFALPRPRSRRPSWLPIAARLSLSALQFSHDCLEIGESWTPALLSPPTPGERIRLSAAMDAIAATTFGLNSEDLRLMLRDSDNPVGASSGLGAKGFWRVGKGKDPELRHTVLTLVAFHDLEARIRAAGGDQDKGIEAFLAQNQGEGWMLPETLRLADYGLGRDDRARHPQRVASRLGPRFYDWQLAQQAEESWGECQLHARNLLGEAGYTRLLEGLKEGSRTIGKVTNLAAGQAETGDLFRAPSRPPARS